MDDGTGRHHTDEDGAEATSRERETPVTSGPRRAWYRRTGWMIVVVVMVAVAAIAGVGFALAWKDRGAQPVSTDDAVQRYRDQQGGGDSTGGFLRPAAGVYTYRAEGTERLSLFDTAQRWADTLPASVSYGDEGCWTLRIDYSTSHWQDHVNCPGDGVLYDAGGTTYQSFDFVALSVADTQVFTCNPRGEIIRIDAILGESWSQSCDGTSASRGTRVTSAGTNTFLGVETIRIGDQDVGALHYRLERGLSGDQSGHENRENWYAVTDGLLLRSRHDTEVASPSPIGDVTYTERGDLQIDSLTPRT